MILHVLGTDLCVVFAMNQLRRSYLLKPALTLDGAVKIAHAMETAVRDASELRELKFQFYSSQGWYPESETSCTCEASEKNVPAPQYRFQMFEMWR